MPDFFIGSSKNLTSSLFLSDNSLYKKIDKPFESNKKSEDTDAVFFDSDNDGDEIYMLHQGVDHFLDMMVI